MASLTKRFANVGYDISTYDNDAYDDPGGGEQFSVSGAFANIYSLLVDESFSTAEALDLVATFLRAFSEAHSVTDSSSMAASKDFSEAFTSTDTFMSVFELLLDEAFSITDDKVFDVTARRDESVAVAEASYKSFVFSLSDSASVVEALVRYVTSRRAEGVSTIDSIARFYDLLVDETISVAPLRRMHLNKRFILSSGYGAAEYDSAEYDGEGGTNEGADVSDGIDTLLTAFLALDDSFSASDSYVLDAIANRAESFTTIGQIVKYITAPKTESFDIADAHAFIYSLLMDEILAFSDARRMTPFSARNDLLSTSDDKVFAVTKVLDAGFTTSDTLAFVYLILLDEAFQVVDAISNTVVFNRTYNDAFSSSDAADTIATYFRTYGDSAASSDDITLTPIKLLNDSIAFFQEGYDYSTYDESLYDADAHGIRRMYVNTSKDDSVTVADVATTAVIFRLYLDEIFTTADAYSLTPTKRLDDTYSLTGATTFDATKTLDGTIALFDAIRKAPTLRLDNGATIEGFLRKQARKVLTDNPALTDDVRFDAVKLLDASFSLLDVVRKTATIAMSDFLVLDDVLKFSATHRGAETVTVTGTVSDIMDFVLFLDENPVVADAFTQTVLYYRAYSENPIGFDDLVRKNPRKALQELYTIADALGDFAQTFITSNVEDELLRDYFIGQLERLDGMVSHIQQTLIYEDRPKR